MSCAIKSPKLLTAGEVGVASLQLRSAAVKVPVIVTEEPCGQAWGVGIGPAPGHGTFVPNPTFVHRKTTMGPERLGELTTWI